MQILLIVGSDKVKINRLRMLIRAIGRIRCMCCSYLTGVESAFGCASACSPTRFALCIHLQSFPTPMWRKLTSASRVILGKNWKVHAPGQILWIPQQTMYPESMHISPTIMVPEVN